MNLRLALALSLFVVACGDDASSSRRDSAVAADGGVDGAFDVGLDARDAVDASDPDAGVRDAGPTDSGPGDAGRLMCGDPECRHCVSQGSCVALAADCALETLPTSAECSGVFQPCDVASCWDPTLSLPSCGARLVDEDFSSGRFSVHRYDATVPGGEPVSLTLRRRGGVYQPMLLITEPGGELIFAGDATSLQPDVAVLDASVSSTEVSVTLQVESTRMLSLWVTDAAAAAGDFSSGVDTSATYRLSGSQVCEGSSLSESVERTNDGSLENAVQITEGDGYVVAETGRNAEYGTQETIDQIRAGLAAVRARHPDAATVQVRDISVVNGGRPSGPWPHASHQSGRDVDVTYHLDSCSGPCPLSDVPLSQFDEEATWTLFEYWLAQDAVTFIFVDTSLQQILYDVAGRRGATSEELDRWFQYPNTGSTGIIRHVSNHLNHHHVRFRCPDDDARCIE
ncbi:MAG: penicillin-insensitive murein endopeptidase [Polyangiales bacterium]